MSPTSPPSESTDASERDTSAGRLYRILEGLRQQHNGTTLITAWARALRVEASDVPSVLKGIALVGNLSIEVRADIERHLPAHRRAWYLEPFPAVEALVNHLNLAEQANIPGRLPPTVFDRLYAAHIALDDRGAVAGARAVRPSALARFRASADALLQEVLADTTLPRGLRELLVGHLEAIRRALIEYEISGVDGLERAVTYAMGMSARERAEIEAIAEATNGMAAPVIVQRTWTFTARLGRVVDWARRHPAETAQILLGIAQVGIGVAQLTTGSAGGALMLPGATVPPPTSTDVPGQVAV